ncbi:MAG: DUF1269 domain-containing family protein [Lactobacillus sp.]|jgi:gas vesicle protein|nr:DUF1269 domain-containing family protein [Lactobacillus sp.]MCH3905985.1 DUF1269 domain-containing family protein [Lactobacillus sp.]MCH3990441.1 DUF1269 domain-containing family protein [Lactobacillus sp.]MCH4068844.1 DUF1269 domain-containing family protein [Lactobacillus sp.]MCI1304469.1 DUF1269 domain-containing family protein [Lactobacillus sp.]
MKKTGSFILGTLFGAGVSLLATSILTSTDSSQKIKEAFAKNDTLASLKKKYDNGTQLLKNQLTSFPKTVEDNSEIKDFDDIVIDKTDHKSNHDKDDADTTISDLENQEN